LNGFGRGDPYLRIIDLCINLGLRVINNSRLESNNEEVIYNSRLQSNIQVIYNSRLESNKEEEEGDPEGGGIARERLDCRQSRVFRGLGVWAIRTQLTISLRGRKIFR